MKKLISFSLLLVIILSLASCVGIGGITEDDCVGTWVSDEHSRYDNYHKETQSFITTIEFFEAGTGTLKTVGSKSCRSVKKGETFFGYNFKWSLKDDTIVIESDDNILSFKFSDEDDTKSTLRDLTYREDGYISEFFHKENK